MMHQENERTEKRPTEQAYTTGPNQLSIPAISLPKGGGALRGIGEKFTANPVTGTGSMSIPIATSPGRSGFGPQLSLSYDSGTGNGPFGLGWSLSLPRISRKTDKGLPKYRDRSEPDIFILSGAEDLVPMLVETTPGRWVPNPDELVTVAGVSYRVEAFRPRIEGLFARIERWTNAADQSDCFWRSISRNNITTWYGRTSESRIADPAKPSHIFSWEICESHDDKGNVISYHYKEENADNVDGAQAHERNRGPISGELDAPDTRTANRYLKRIKYGNEVPYFPKLLKDGPWPSLTANDECFFEVVFDYGEHHADAPLPASSVSKWKVRPDPFSSYRAGFEIRTYRLCQRVLMFHHFDGEANVGRDCLVRSTDFTYSHDLSADFNNPVHSLLISISQSGYKRQAGAYLRRSLPPLEFNYSVTKIDETVRSVEPASLENLPSGLDGSNYQWVDLDGEGSSGILIRQGSGWFYKRNLSQLNVQENPTARFAALEFVSSKPSLAKMGNDRQQFLDLDGNGQLELVDFERPTPGFYERTDNERWQSFVPFSSLPVIDWDNGNLRFLDLTGDGHADILITEDDVFRWYPSLAAEGFGSGKLVHPAWDDEKGPRLVFADGTQSIYLADFCGDGLTDLVRIRNGEVCYWPNLGYGNFGAKVTMDHAPWFDNPEQFNQQRIRLADIDGSGLTDIIYLASDAIRIYFNQSGNSWSEGHTLTHISTTDNLSSITVADLLGNGTACLVLSSPLPGAEHRSMRYIDLMGGQKPHLLIRMRNNLGAETEIEYAPSTKFYLADKQAGTPWITKLPFPVHCVARVTVSDRWRQTAFSSTYSYHHGYFDGVEREFRGFGRVEQVDIESFGKFKKGNVDSPYITSDETLYQPPIKTVTWFHTGAALDRSRILSQFEKEYFPARYTWSTSFREKALSEPDLSTDDLNAVEWREALRACKGSILRQEVYELGVDALTATVPHQVEVRLFSVATHSLQIKLLQPRGPNSQAVFLLLEREAITYNYELDLLVAPLQPDPRIAHTLVLRQDEYGQTLQSIAVGYERVQPWSDMTHPGAGMIREVQSERHLSYTETRYTDDLVAREIADPGSPIKHHRLRLPCEQRTYELKGIDKGTSFYYELEHFRRLSLSDFVEYRPALRPSETALAVVFKAYHEMADGSSPQRRLIDDARTLYFNDVDGISQPLAALPFGQLGPRGLKFEDYKLALTDDLLNAVFQSRDPAGALVDDKLAVNFEPGVNARSLLADSKRSGYVAGSTIAPGLAGQHWIRSGVAGFANNAAEHFYLPERYTDPFGNVTTIAFDKRNLFIESRTDALENMTQVTQFDFRVLAPRELKDQNNNFSVVVFDTLGLPTATAVLGKRPTPNGPGESGDNLNNVNPDISITEVEQFFTQAFNAGTSRSWLGDATARFVYDLGEQVTNGKVTYGNRPAAACAILRETHLAQTVGVASKLQVAVEYSDGLGTVLVKKTQAEPARGDASLKLKWIASGKTVLNNKGKPVKQYEPYFSATEHRFDPDEAERETGVTPVLYYDAAGRLMRTEFPDGSYSRVDFSPWFVASSDKNDTAFDTDPARRSDWYKRRTDPTHPRFEEFNNSQERQAAELVQIQTNTPAVVHLDSLGRDVISVAHNRYQDELGALRDEKYVTLTRLDAEGKPLWIRDARKNLVMQYIRPTAPNDQVNDPPASSTPCYDVSGNLLFQHSMDAGDRWLLHDAAGKPMVAWDSNERQNASGEVILEDRIFFTRYDALHRPLENSLAINGGLAQTIERFEYVDAKENADIAGAKAKNLCGQLHKHFDSSGLNQVESFDFKSNPLEVRRQLARDFKAQVIDWQPGSATGVLETETFARITEYDALNRMTRLYNWHNLAPGSRVAVYEPQYSERGLLAGETIIVRATKTAAGHTEGPDAQRVLAVRAIQYDVKGQRQLVELGNNSITRYHYDAETFRLRQLRTTRPGFDPSFPGPANGLRDEKVLQNLQYTYDPIGNITEIRDNAYEPAFFKNQLVEAVSKYTYDSLYRLITATGRENGAAVGATAQFEKAPFEVDFPLSAAGTLRNYRQEYQYDSVGNIKQVRHVAGDPGSWTRTYTYFANSNRLLDTTLGADQTTYRYDSHGNMLNLANVALAQSIRWDYRDMIHFLDLQGGGRAFYNYDANSQRARKRIERLGAIVEERIDLGGLELYRKFNSGVLVEEIESIQLVDGSRRVLLIDDVLLTDNARLSTGPLYRYQYDNHLGSAVLELDQRAQIISYEEYHPYGSSAYRAVNKAIEAPPKRYRYTGKERDEESGLYYHGARYYAPWLGRWTSCDPAGVTVGLNLYEMVNGNPLIFHDPTGYFGEEIKKKLQAVQQKVLPVAKEVARGGLDASVTFAKETFAKTTPGIAVMGTLTAVEVIQTVKDSPNKSQALLQAATVQVEKANATLDTAVPGSTVIRATRKFAEAKFKRESTTEAAIQSSESVVEKIPFADAAQDLQKTVTAARSGNVAGVVHGTITGGRHFGEQVVNIAGGFAGGGGRGAKPPSGSKPAPTSIGSGGQGGGGSAGGPTGGGSPMPQTYTVLAEAVLEEKAVAGDRAAHYQEADSALKKQLDAQREVYKSPYRVNAIEDIRSVKEPLRKDGTGSVGGTAWHHHPFKEGLMQLVYRAEHQSPLLQRLFHPGGRGGFSRWLKKF
jgi:RHS repeat-associated protein